MIHIHLKSPNEELEFEHSVGPLEFGRGPQRAAPRKTVDDPYMSYNQLVVEELLEDELRIDNLSEHVEVEFDNAESLGLQLSRVVKLPVKLRIGNTNLEISTVHEQNYFDESTTHTIDSAFSTPLDLRSLRDLGGAPDPETLARWFETVICVQQAAANSSEFFIETARAVVNLVGLDRGLVLLREEQDWKIAAQHNSDSSMEPALFGQPQEFSYRVLHEVLKTGKTYYQTMGSAPATASLKNVEAVVAAPIFDGDRKIVGVVYGSRGQGLRDISSFESDLLAAGISALEAQIIQVLAAAVGAGLERVRQQADAMRSQLQFENFFSSKLASELARDPNLLEGREREVTIMFSDVRDFSLISEHLGASETLRMMQEVMDLQTSTIHKYDGVVVDYVGDGLLAMWNAPTEQSNHATLACKAVLEIMRQLPTLNDKWQSLLNRPLQLGVGVNTGNALVGNTGSRVKFKYGPMGSAVNLASRVEDASKRLGGHILLTESTFRQLDDSFACRRLCTASLPGILSPVDLFELRTEENSPAWQNRKKVFEIALTHFTEKRWAEACHAIYPLISNSEGDFDIPSLHLLSRAVECLKSNPDPFDPIVHVKTKQA